MTRITDNTRKALQHREISVPQRFFRLMANGALQSRRIAGLQQLLHDKLIDFLTFFSPVVADCFGLCLIRNCDGQVDRVGIFFFYDTVYRKFIGGVAVIVGDD